MSDHKINICHLYPDLLNLYGDNGNILCMKKRLESRGIECTVTGLSVGDKLNAGDYDIFFISRMPFSRMRTLTKRQISARL